MVTSLMPLNIMVYTKKKMALSCLNSPSNVITAKCQTVPAKIINCRLSWLLWNIISQTSFHCFYVTGADTSDEGEKNTQASTNLGIKVLNNSTCVHPCTSLKVHVYEKCPEDKSKAWNWTTFFAGNLHPETRDLITLIIISACWAELPKLLVVIKLPNCFLNSTVVFDSVTSLVNEFHRLTIHMHKALFTSICSEFTAPYFLSSISLSASYYGTRLKKKKKVSFVIVSASIKDFCKIHWILESFIRKMKNWAIFHPVSINILFSSWLLITCEFYICYISSFYIFHIIFSTGMTIMNTLFLIRKFKLIMIWKY